MMIHIMEVSSDRVHVFSVGKQKQCGVPLHMQVAQNNTLSSKDHV